MTVALAYLRLLVGGGGVCARREFAGVAAQAHGPAFRPIGFLPRQVVYDGIGRVGVELGAIGLGQAEHIAGELDDRALEAQAETQVRDAVRAGELSGQALAAHAARAKAAWHHNALNVTQQPRRPRAFELFRVDPLEVEVEPVEGAGMT